MWTLFLCLSLAVMIAFFVWAGFQRRICSKNRRLTPRVIVITGVAAAAIIWYLPVFGHADFAVGGFDVFVRSVLSTIQLFTAEGFKDLPKELFTSLPKLYVFFGNVLVLSAPFFTFALILSYFKTVSAYVSYCLAWKEAYIFSELNDKSLSMAKSIKDDPNRKRCVIVFADIIDKNEESHLDLVDGAKVLDAILFRKDVEAVKWDILPRLFSKRLNFYLISEDESEKIRQAKHIVECYNTRRCALYVFSDSEVSKNLLNSYNEHKDIYPIHLNLMRIDAVRLLTYSYLADNGVKLFKNATDTGGLKVINATIVGFGKYGSEMLKALVWFCQMPGYKINLKVIDRDERCRSRFEAMLPGIKVGESHDDDNDVRYQVEFITATFGESGFIDAVSSLPEKNYFFISLGNDETNMLASTAIRCAREQAGKTDNPHTGDDGDIVTTVIYSSDVKELVRPEVNVIGDLNTFYSYETITGNCLVKNGYEEHLLWSSKCNNVSGPGDEDEITRNEYQLSAYNFNSSIAKALHRRLHEQMIDFYDGELHEVLKGTRNFADAKDYLSDIVKHSDSSDSLAKTKLASKIEHVRWNAYMRSEGFVYNKKRETKFMMHDKLVPVNDDELTHNDRLKDI